MSISKILEYWYTYLYLATALSPSCHSLALPCRSLWFTDEGIYSLQRRGPQLQYKDKGPFWLLDAYFIPEVIKHFGVCSWIYTSMMKWNCQGSVISLLLSHHNKDLKQWTLKPLACHSSRTVRVIVLRQISFI